MAKHMQIRSGSDLGRAIAEIRLAQDRSARETAELAGITPQYLSQIETGRTTRLLDHDLRILRRLGARVIVEFPDDT